MPTDQEDGPSPAETRSPVGASNAGTIQLLREIRGTLEAMALVLQENQRILKMLEAGLDRVAAPVITPAEAMRLVGKRSSSTFYSWLQKRGVKAVEQGRYSRAQIERALADEAGVSYRRHQITKRRAVDG